MQPLSADTLRAARLLAEGDFRSALQAAQQGLQAEPANAPLWNLLGVCAARLGQLPLAAQCWHQALARDAATPDAHYNLGCLHAEQGEAAEAETHYRAELARDGEHVSSLGNLGALLLDSGRINEAEACFRRVVVLQPQAAAAHYNLGRLLRQQGRGEEAAERLRQSLVLEPDDAEALQLLGQLLVELGQPAEAENLLRRALEWAPGHAAALNNLGLLLLEQRRWGEAEDCLRQAHARQPEAVLGNLVALLSATNRPAEAEALLREALLAAPGHVEWLCLLGVALQEQGRSREAEQIWRRGLALSPQHRRLRQNLGYLQLARGDYQAGWQNHEARLMSSHYPQPDSPRWQGEPLAGRHLLLVFEQGYGDAIQFFRYLPLLRQRGAARLTLMCREPLLALFSAHDPAAECLPILRTSPDFPPHDCHVFSMSLPGLLRAEPLSLPCYLRADSSLGEAWRRRLPPDGRKIGLVWRGHLAHPFDHCRSLPTPALFEPLCARSDAHWISVQPDPVVEEREWVKRHCALELGSALGDFASSAALLAQLDLLITVDTAMAHLAGALGVPCRLLLSSEHTDWRWGEEGEVTPWYPSARLVRQRRGEDWAAVIGRMGAP
ncbi:tetratricopeptide repeat protein [Chromobacterium sphagni]|uniref:Uncharacterized protein n=1 Tax=Chromobacterium sphagni TaxID=1903179 RepID=A0A1S1WZN3_9NEIS|nr:tetratricopeptide repeat protein [Chromobacterium sphagni]OHX12743.1 hypothetical protein BI347_03930 [Chromobacterium sphagni]OHX21114.1 hypothetical protein BI344_00780 [Chromobacterium sphagni]